MGRLDDLDLGERIGAKEYVRRLQAAQRRLLQLRLHLGGQMGDSGLGPGLLVIFEGRDAGGKGGAIKRAVENLDPRHYTVHSFAAPTYDEKRHHFLWRFYKAIPGQGGMCLFDRSWYGRVLVERVEGFASDEQWTRAYDEIVQFERTLVLEGLILVKFWMHISDDEQSRRFAARAEDPLKAWKLTDEDWRNRDRNRDYDTAAEELFHRTDHSLAPWDLIGAEQKRLARVRVLEALNSRIVAGMERWGTPVPGEDAVDS
ncbi:MAG: polyphosphate kinase 2 family protein [Acidimicrobiales bacterium]